MEPRYVARQEELRGVSQNMEYTSRSRCGVTEVLMRCLAIRVWLSVAQSQHKCRMVRMVL